MEPSNNKISITKKIKKVFQTNILFLLIFSLIKIIVIGVFDAIEHTFNKDVYIVHNFPDILRIPYKKGDILNNFRAFKSGIICGIDPYLAIFILTGLVLLKKKKIFDSDSVFKKIQILSLLGLISGFTISTLLFWQHFFDDYNNRQFMFKDGRIYNTNIYNLHEIFYVYGAIIEIITFFMVIFFVY
ncbi:hypothetical protein DMUE_2723 [Dictyocoela muelleri]|nr:hypothetical protein DMUE_2723 [Dictyocoela muelleri]